MSFINLLRVHLAFILQIDCSSPLTVGFWVFAPSVGMATPVLHPNCFHSGADHFLLALLWIGSPAPAFLIWPGTLGTPHPKQIQISLSDLALNYVWYFAPHGCLLLCCSVYFDPNCLAASWIPGQCHLFHLRVASLLRRSVSTSRGVASGSEACSVVFNFVASVSPSSLWASPSALLFFHLELGPSTVASSTPEALLASMSESLLSLTFAQDCYSSACSSLDCLPLSRMIHH